MIRSRQSLWRSLTAISLASSLAACAPAGRNAGEHDLAGSQDEEGEAGAGGGASARPTASAPSGEAGEAGLAGVMEGLSDAERSAVRLQQLKGFFLAADALMRGSDLTPAAVLIGQGVLEVYTAFPGDMANYDPSQAETASRIGLGRNPSRPAMAWALRNAMADVDAEIVGLDVNGAVIAGRMIEASEGLYRHVDLGDGLIDETERQHSFAAAIAARDALVRDESRLRRINAPAYAEALREIEAFIDLWNATAAPNALKPLGDVLAQGSRAQLALSALQSGG